MEGLPSTHVAFDHLSFWKYRKQNDGNYSDLNVLKRLRHRRAMHHVFFINELFMKRTRERYYQSLLNDLGINKRKNRMEWYNLRYAWYAILVHR